MNIIQRVWLLHKNNSEVYMNMFEMKSTFYGSKEHYSTNVINETFISWILDYIILHIEN